MTYPDVASCNSFRLIDRVIATPLQVTLNYLLLIISLLLFISKGALSGLVVKSL